MTVTKLDTFTQLSDFDKAGKRIASGIAGYEKLMQSASIAALQHIEKHGNSNVLEPLYRATLAWRNKRMSNAWVAWVVSYSWFIFNPRNLKGQALTKAKEEGFHSLWVKSKGKEMNIDGAKGEPWYEAKPDAKAVEPVQAAVKIAAIQKMMNKLLADGMLHDTDGKPINLGKLRTEFRAMIETLEVPHKPVVTTEKPKAKAKAKVEPKAPKAKPPKAKPPVSVAPTVVAA